MPSFGLQEAGGGPYSNDSQHCQRVTPACRSHGESNRGAGCRDPLQVLTLNHIICHFISWLQI